MRRKRDRLPSEREVTKLTTLYDKQNGLCWYCKRPTILRGHDEEYIKAIVGVDTNGTYSRRKANRRRASVDHITPRSKGGIRTRDNVVMACQLCNSRKSDMDYGDFLRSLKVKRKSPTVLHKEWLETFGLHETAVLVAK